MRGEQRTDHLKITC